MNEKTELIGNIPFTKGEYAYIRKHIGEQIAREIRMEKIKECSSFDCAHHCVTLNTTLNAAAAIAEGQR